MSSGIYDPNRQNVSDERKETVVSNNNGGSITFPYASFEQGQQDNWRKIDGPAEAFRLMVNGYKQGYWRKGYNDKKLEQQKKDKVRLQLLEAKVAEMEKERGTKAERQLGREKGA